LHIPPQPRNAYRILEYKEKEKEGETITRIQMTTGRSLERHVEGRNEENQCSFFPSSDFSIGIPHIVLLTVHMMSREVPELERSALMYFYM
jgi:hypothetical protein